MAAYEPGAEELYPDFQDFSSTSTSPIDQGYGSPSLSGDGVWSELSTEESSATASPTHYTSDLSPIALPSLPAEDASMQPPPTKKKRHAKFRLIINY